MKRLRVLFICAVMLVCSLFASCSCVGHNIDYSDLSNWAYYQTEIGTTKADVFFVAPTVYAGSEENQNMQMEDQKTKQNFLGAINMEKGIYDGEARFFAPYYRQAGFLAYSLEKEITDYYLTVAYNDIRFAFYHYLENENNGRPIVLAGFSQGSDLCIRLLKEFFKDENVNKQLVACYAIGWRITEKDVNDYKYLKFAKGETDTGVVISYNCESEGITESLMIPKNTKTLCINPLNWKTDGTVADKLLNKGACFTNYGGQIVKEVAELTGAYIDNSRGALKVTDVLPEDYPPVIDNFANGIYHVYDYQFFYRNLQENVSKRIQAFLSK